MSNSIQEIINKNKIKDLENFLERRHRLNNCNSTMIYLFHIIQSVGILATSYAASTNNASILWTGIGLNMCASIIQIYEKINNDQMKRIYFDIQSISNGTYLDESPFIDMESTQQQLKQTNTNQPSEI